MDLRDGLPPPVLLDDGAAIAVTLRGARYRFHAVWLRDNAQDAATRSPGNRQRLIRLADIPPETRIADARWSGDRLAVRFTPDDKSVDYDAGWLAAHAYDKPHRSDRGWTDAAIIRWDAGLSDPDLEGVYDAVWADAGARLRWLRAIERTGFARLRGVPATSDAPAAIARLFGYVRETNYGRIFDVRVEANPNNLASTNLGLQAHTDNPYRDPVPGLQILACLLNEVDGGETIVVDGFEVARRLQTEWPEGFGLLARHPARFDYAGTPGVRLRSKKPLIELGPDGELLAVRFNNRSAAPFIDIPYDRMADYYRAYRRMAALIDDPALAIRFKLMPGDAFVVDNQRVLHARVPITSGGRRHLRGCYVDRDGLRSAVAALQEGA